METRVLKSSFSGIKGTKKKRKLLEESSTSYLGPGCREFESRHSDQISRNSFMPFLLISFGGETRNIKSQYAGGILLPPVQKLVATSICAYRRRCKRVSPLGPEKDLCFVSKHRSFQRNKFLAGFVNYTSCVKKWLLHGKDLWVLIEHGTSLCATVQNFTIYTLYLHLYGFHFLLI